MNQIGQANSALNYLNAGCTREDWIRIGMAAKSAGLSFDDFHNWSQAGNNYKGKKECTTVWNSFKETGGITAATLFAMALEKGWQGPNKNHTNTPNLDSSHNNYQTEKISQESDNEETSAYVFDIWERCLSALPSHDYILRKQGKPDGLRYYPSTEPTLTINGKNVTNYLVVPCWSNNTVQTLQFIPPDGGRKLNLPRASFNDGYFVIGHITETIYVVEGIGQAWAINKTSGNSAVICFGAGRIRSVAEVLREKYPSSHIIIIPDRGKEKQAAEIATAVCGAWVKIPPQFPINYDANDYLLEHGENDLRDLLAHPEMPLSVIFADNLPYDFTPPDELVEGVLIIGDGSIVYGDSNSGKTFIAIDLACAVARGVPWIGRKTEPGLVVYLAAESPTSVQRRLQAYQKHHNIRVKNFAIVQSPINLFDGDADTNAIIQVIHLLEKQYGQKARLIIGDTLARLSAGANENAGQDMGLVVRHFDHIRNECKAHFMLIHHSGKNAAAGARGWSGVRAAVDTEIEITDSPTGRCAEITKQRDLDTKGIRIGFRLEPITLGLTKWKSLATSCVVTPADAPPKSSGKRLSEVGGAIAEFLCISDKPIKKRELVRHFEDRYTKSAIYRELKKLVEAGSASDCMGFVTALNQS